MRLGWLLVAGCAGEQSFPERFVEAYCDDVLRCEPYVWQVLFYDARECQDTLLPEQEAASEGCGYDPDAGRACLSALAELGCDAFAAGGWAADCAGAWDCDQK